jgi:ribosomal protein L16 Arg81 hydroxylase
MGQKRTRDDEGGALEQLLGVPTEAFFEDHWETSPLVCRGGAGRGALDGLPDWDTLLGLLDCASTIVVLKDQHPTTEYESVASAYLDGCSVIVNHLERSCEAVRSLCQRLRHDVPHCFGNLYLTPPQAQAVDAHADDRDVIVLQLAGSKRWRVWSVPPVVRPGPHEQVGKNGRAVPEAVMDSAPLCVTLSAGDALYMPRGFVHEACTDETCASLHLTLALPTDDWSWASLVEAAMTSVPQLGSNLLLSLSWIRTSSLASAGFEPPP